MVDDGGAPKKKLKDKTHMCNQTPARKLTGLLRDQWINYHDPSPTYALACINRGLRKENNQDGRWTGKVLQAGLDLTNRSNKTIADFPA
mmetsp:Transcript_20777/g.67357  ORF Transcript_20777/g.67357 Transcript_20777/m.67357 type:complete len:89 (+) Transcript_20777:35-301(+)